MEIFLCLVIGLIAGVGSGLFGIGGGIIIVPLLVVAYGFGQQKAQGTSLVALLAPVGLLAVKNYWDKQLVDMPKGLWIAAGFIGGAYLGSKIAVGLDPVVMRKMFSVFLVVVAAYLWLKG